VPKFNANRWKVTDDTSLGFRTTDSHRVVLNMVTRPVTGDAMTEHYGCPCGCATIPTGVKAKFAMGHDATLRGKLIRAHLMGVEIRYVINGNEDEGFIKTPMQIAEQYGWKEYLDAAVLRREGKNREVLQKSIGDERLVRVGRWEYTGQVAAVYRDPTGSDMHVVEYVDRAGQVRRTRVLADEEEAA
jgi:hypothetical protein